MTNTKSTSKLSSTKLFFWSLTAALAGFLFGFDTVVISGAEQPIQELWGLSSTMHGLAMSAALWGTVLGSLIGSWPTDLFGRKKTLMSIGILYLVSAIWSALANDPISFMVARFLGGLGVGISTVAAPLFISEIAPAEKRGRLAGMFQFNIVFGILIAFASNAALGGLGDSGWRWMLGVEAIPALIYSLMCFNLPESPRWLIGRKDDRAGGIAVLRQINPSATDAEIEAKADEIAAVSHEAASTGHFWTKRLKTPILLAFLIALFNQLSGINAILYFAPRLLGLAGLSDPLMASISLGVTNLIFTFVGLALIDKLGRRTLLYIGSFGYIVSLGICSWAFLSTPALKVVSAAGDLEGAAATVMAVEAGERFVAEKDRQNLYDDFEAAKVALVEAGAQEAYEGDPVTIPAEASYEETRALAVEVTTAAKEFLGFKSMLVLVCLIGFIAAHAVGQGAVIWVFISEIFPNRHRAQGQSLGSFTHWIFAALLTLFFPSMVNAFAPGIVFAFFCFMMVLQLIWVKVMVPETKGRPLEQIEHELGSSAS